MSKNFNRKNRSGYVALIVVGLLVTGLVVFLLMQSNVLPFGDQAKNQFVMTDVASKGDLLVTVTEDGTLESAANVEVKCQVAGGSSILWIIPDGTYVKEGDKIVELDSAQLEDQIIAQKNVLENAKATKIQAENDYSVAKISVKEYEEGTFKKELQDAETQVTIALENLRNAENSLEHSQKMFRKGYLSKLELESQTFAVKRSQLELESANSAKDVLIKFTKAKQLEDLQSKVATSEAKMNSEIRSYELEENKLKKLEAQKDNCVIYAPQSGMVVYANSKSRWGQQTAVIEEGATVRERQAIIKLPDLTKMQVNVKVHESKVELLKPGLRAVVRVQGQDLQGTVDFVANQPEQAGFMQAKVQEYATIISIDGQQQGLKPGMTAETQVLVTHEKNVLKIPVASIVKQGGKYFAWVDNSGKYERRELLLGASDENFVVIKDGVSEGEDVILNPRAVVEEARGDGDSSEGDVKEDVSKFGDTSKAPKVDPTKRPEQKESKDGDKKSPAGKKQYGKGGGKSGGGSFDPSAIFDRMDADSNGKLEGDEISSQWKSRLMAYDKDKDDAISKKEFSDGMKAAMSKWKK
ncbi:MAG: HlyD family efflux transporter periplasmic adaptor subunit [Planctomycetota bacterium]|nr:HlyD family efflux transporter periplasmic adaptor subunit [Planctomycetota bacterium]